MGELDRVDTRLTRKGDKLQADFNAAADHPLGVNGVLSKSSVELPANERVSGDSEAGSSDRTDLSCQSIKLVGKRHLGAALHHELTVECDSTQNVEIIRVNNTMKTCITQLFGIQHPAIQGGMHHVGLAELAAAVSNAGGLGMITGLTQRSPDLLAREIRRCRDMTEKPFGVNLPFLPTVNPPDYPGYINAIINGGVMVVETAGNNPQQWLPLLHEAGVKVIHKCTSVRHALKAQSIGCDALSIDGFECGGHPGEDDVPNFILLPRAADELKIPFIASGGMADGRSLVAALALGAEGINMGTRFIATKEAPVHENVKNAIVAASVLDTRLVMRPLRNTERVLKNSAVERLLAKEHALGQAIKFEVIIEEVAGVYPRIMQDGAMDAGAWSCGMVAGLIRDIPTVQQLIDRIMAEAESILCQRLAQFAGSKIEIH